HDIYNPLGIILNRIECIETVAAHLDLPEDLRRDLQAIRSQADRISRVTKSMLASSRGAATILKPIDVNCVLRSSIEVVKERAVAKNIGLETVLAADLPPIMGDRDRLETVMLNLMNNALDAAAEGTQPSLVTVRSEQTAGPDGDWVTVTVSDSGPGIPEDQLGRIFEPFFTTKAESHGTGMGLFLSYGIVADHRGRLAITNGQRGAVASVFLPALAAVSESQQEAGWEQARY
ncbi:MAG: sensor histidine kinase, partial [Nitrospiraceae bacterium]